jgi:hypothetical protein
MIEMSGSSLWRVVSQILPLGAGLFFDITAYDAAPGGPALANQAAINKAIAAAAAAW